MKGKSTCLAAESVEERGVEPLQVHIVENAAFKSTRRKCRNFFVCCHSVSACVRTRLSAVQRAFVRLFLAFPLFMHHILPCEGGHNRGWHMQDLTPVCVSVLCCVFQ